MERIVPKMLGSAAADTTSVIASTMHNSNIVKPRRLIFIDVSKSLLLISDSGRPTARTFWGLRLRKRLALENTEYPSNGGHCEPDRSGNQQLV
jgi:hypothetical protein